MLGKAFRDRAADAKAALERSAAGAGALDAWSHDALEAVLRALAEELGVKAGDLFSLLRVAVTGRKITPPLFESMEIPARTAALRGSRRRLIRSDRSGCLPVVASRTAVLDFNAIWGFV